MSFIFLRSFLLSLLATFVFLSLHAIPLSLRFYLSLSIPSPQLTQPLTTTTLHQQQTSPSPSSTRPTPPQTPSSTPSPPPSPSLAHSTTRQQPPKPLPPTTPRSFLRSCPTQEVQRIPARSPCGKRTRSWLLRGGSCRCRSGAGCMRRGRWLLVSRGERRGERGMQSRGYGKIGFAGLMPESGSVGGGWWLGSM